MLRKIILLLIISALAISGFAQKSKRKTNFNAPRASYFEILINGETTPAANYCPYDSITFDFRRLNSEPLDSTIIGFCWKSSFHVQDTICDITPVKFWFPFYEEINRRNFNVTLIVKVATDSVPFLDTLITYFLVDYFRTELDTSVCQGRNITLPTLAGDTTIYDVQTDLIVQFGTFQSASGCDSIVAWKITMNPYITEEHEISACDSVIWGREYAEDRIVIKRPYNATGDWDTTVYRKFKNLAPNNYCCDCDTLKYLTVTIIDSAKLEIDFSQEDFCKDDDMQGLIELKTNFTAFDWTFYKDKEKKRDSTWTVLQEASQEILNPGYYYVKAYMDTSLYEILTDLRIFDVDCYLKADTLVEDCPLIIPNVITPNGDEVNQFFGIKKLNLERENELTIYDRWGKIVFQQKNYQCIFKGGQFHNTEEAFEGLSRGGQKLPDGAYYYAVKYDALGDKVPKK